MEFKKLTKFFVIFVYTLFSGVSHHRFSDLVVEEIM
jgi:hypothetical protein